MIKQYRRQACLWAFQLRSKSHLPSEPLLDLPEKSFIAHDFDHGAEIQCDDFRVPVGMRFHGQQPEAVVFDGIFQAAGQIAVVKPALMA